MDKRVFYIAVIDYATAAAERRPMTTSDLHNDLDVVILKQEDFIGYMNDVFGTNYREVQKRQFINFAKTKDMGDGTPNLIYLAQNTFDSFPTFDDIEEYEEDEYDFSQHVVTDHRVLIDLINYDQYTKNITAEDYVETLTYGVISLRNDEAIKSYIDKFGEFLDESKEVYKNSNTTITEALRSLR